MVSHNQRCIFTIQYREYSTVGRPTACIDQHMFHTVHNLKKKTFGDIIEQYTFVLCFYAIVKEHQGICTDLYVSIALQHKQQQ